MKTNITRDELDELEHELDLEARTDYSGRGMYGDTCIGFDVDSLAELVRIGAVAQQLFGDDNPELVHALARGARTDSMGLGSIVYWPGISLAVEVTA